jgi:hypothetical protein
MLLSPLGDANILYSFGFDSFLRDLERAEGLQSLRLACEDDAHKGSRRFLLALHVGVDGQWWPGVGMPSALL